jgi:parallel beta-helix repeat protein
MVTLLVLAFGAQVGAQSGGGLPQEVTKSIQLRPGIYHPKQPLRVTGSDLVLDGNGATLIGNGDGIGLEIGKTQGVTVKNLHVKGFRWGVHAEGATGLKLIQVDASGNQNHPEAAAGTAVADASGAKEPDYGGGILLRGVKGSTLQQVQASGEWNGLTLSGCSKIVIYGCDLSKNDDTGLHLWNSSDNEIRDSRMDGVGIGIVANGGFTHKGGDQAGILIEHDSCRNRFLGNTFLHCGGSGLLLRANELAPVPATEASKYETHSAGDQPFLIPTHPSDDNVFDGNDGSFADGRAFECHASSGSVFVNNVASFSDFGFWLSLVRKTQVKKNFIVGSRTGGIELDNGWTNAIESNTLVRDFASNLAMRFSDDVANGAHPVQGAQNPNGDLRIYDNDFVGYAQCLQFVNTTPATVQSNQFYGLESANPDDIATSSGPSPLIILNTTPKHVGPDFTMSMGNTALLPGPLDPLSQISVATLAPKATEGIIQGSLTGRFQGEEYEIGRVDGELPAELAFPPRTAPFVRVVGAAPSLNAFIARMGDASLALHRPTQASSGADTSDNATSGEWNNPAKSWQPNDQAGQWWQVDLGKTFFLTGFAIEGNLQDPNAFWSKFHVLVSRTGYFEGEEQPVGTETDWKSRPGPVRVYRVPPIRARFVRIVADEAKAGVQMQQFAAYGRTN